MNKNKQLMEIGQKIKLSIKLINFNYYVVAEENNVSVPIYTIDAKVQKTAILVYDQIKKRLIDSGLWNVSAASCNPFGVWTEFQWRASFEDIFRIGLE